VELETDLEDAHQIPHLVPLLVHALEDQGRLLPQRGDLEATLDQIARLAASGLRLNDVLEILEGELRIVQPREIERSEAQLVRRHLRRARLLEPPLEKRREVR